MGAAHFLKILEDAAFELIDVGQAHFLHQEGGFFAADAAGAEADHGLALQFGLVCCQCLRELGEFADAPVNGTSKRARVHFKGIAGVQCDYAPTGIVMALVQPALDGGCRHRRRTACCRADGGVVHADDFVFYLHPHFLEGLAV